MGSSRWRGLRATRTPIVCAVGGHLRSFGSAYSGRRAGWRYAGGREVSYRVTRSEEIAGADELAAVAMRSLPCSTMWSLGQTGAACRGKSAHFSPEILERSDDSIERLMLVESELFSAASKLESRAPVCPS
jgi:hypothetical protein